ncbi:MAG: Gfo/Idh/MocA family oxidoreductase [Bacteroidota bacterium]
MSKIRTALCSYGMSGRVFHAPLLEAHPAFALTHVWQRSKQDALVRYPEITLVRNLEDLLSNKEIDLIIVNTPESTHHAFANKALQAGKHVVVEKAFTATLEEARNLLALADQHTRMISVFHNRRWDSDFLTVQQVIRQQFLGRLVEYEAYYDRFRNYIRPHSWKEQPTAGTGILHNLGSHLIDQALCLFGMPDQVFADIRIQRTDGQVADHFELILYYPNHKATLKAGYLVREAGPKYRLLGTEGSFLKYGEDPQEQALKEGQSPDAPGWGEEKSESWGLLNTNIGKLHVRGKIESIAGNYRAYYDNIRDAILLGHPLHVSGIDGMNVMKVIEAAQQSSEAGKRIELAS